MKILRMIRAALGRFAPGAARVLPWSGGAVMLLGVAFALRSWADARPKQRASATVVENAASFGPAGGVLYTPRLRFRTPDGAIVLLLIPPGSGQPEFTPGQVLPVLYPTGQPRQATIGTAWRVYPTAILLGVVGIALFDIGLILRLMLRVRR